ncbi:hypothetical protein K501DRAFT_287208 [Backusella circina FSU 941]|nr:hypothetical protein K501DRAFT_287208 [Backusella circina FSU 941]
MEQNNKTKSSKPTTYSNDYEYRIYDKNIVPNVTSEYGPCPIVVMSRHQGFEWNDELFVNAYRRSGGYECHKSTSLVNRERRVSQSADTTSSGVVDIKLTEADCDIWP